ncbi:MAG: glycosyltransferase family 2 protein [Actinomycetota bacterium]|nr:glycosyltransferase family 2 protein [Actinomycetota bacterium]
MSGAQTPRHPATPEITVVVVTWEARDLVVGCLDSLARQGLDRSRWAVHVVDNGSHDGTAAAIAQHHPDATVQRLERNLGFAGGVAAALGVVSSPWVVLLNNDARAGVDFLEALARARDADLEADLPVAAWTARVLLAQPVDGQERVNSTGVVVHRDGNGADRDWLVPAADSHPPADVFGFCGAAVMLDTAAVAGVGGFDAAYFLYYEDTDLSWRLRLGGWSVHYVHDAVVHHEHGSSSGLGSPVFRFHNERNRLTTLLKDAPWRLVMPVVLRHPVMSLVRIARGGSARTDGLLRLHAYAAFVRRVPRTLAARRAMPADMQRRRADVARLLGP